MSTTNTNTIVIAVLMILSAHGLLASRVREQGRGEKEEAENSLTSLDNDLLEVLQDKSRNVTHAVNELLLAKANANAKARYTQASALMYACSNQDSSVVKLLIEHHADVKYEKNGDTALHRAATKVASRPHGECGIMTKLLLEAQADPNVEDNLWCGTPFAIALKTGSDEAAAMLLEYGAACPNKPMMGYEEIQSPLQIVKKYGRRLINGYNGAILINVLLAAGALPESLEDLTNEQITLVFNISNFKESVKEQNRLKALKESGILNQYISVDALVLLIQGYYEAPREIELNPWAVRFRERLIEQVAQESQPELQQEVSHAENAVAAEQAPSKPAEASFMPEQSQNSWCVLS